MFRHKSVKAISSPEFVNLNEDAVNPGISECEIKVLYLGDNRNHTSISRETAEKMAKTLPGTPIVGAYSSEKEDFNGHGHVLTIEDGEASFSCTTVPIGFVAPDKDVWFQDFEDYDDELGTGQPTVHTYLMAHGYLWTGQYPEAKTAFAGKGQSMEINVTDGHWGDDFEIYIIDDAEFSKLCVLGDDVEPCMEGAAIASEFSLGEQFDKDLYNMFKELQFSLKGGTVHKTKVFTEEPVEEVVEESVAEEPTPEEETASTEEPKVEEGVSEEEESSEETDTEANVEDALAEMVEECAELTRQLEELTKRFELLEAENEQLKAFKLEREAEDKDKLIARYHMLSEEDKADVISHRDEYSLSEIESKLALAYVRANVDFDTVDGKPAEEKTITETFSVSNMDNLVEIDPLLAALRETTV